MGNNGKQSSHFQLPHHPLLVPCLEWATICFVYSCCVVFHLFLYLLKSLERAPRCAPNLHIICYCSPEKTKKGFIPLPRTLFSMQYKHILNCIMNLGLINLKELAMFVTFTGSENVASFLSYTSK